MKTTFFLVSALGILLCAGVAQNATDTPSSPPPSPEMVAALAADRAYEELYAKADFKALAEYFAEDAEYTSDDGRTFTGREDIAQCLRDAFAANKGAKLTITPDSVRLLSPDVLSEKGSTVVTSKDGDIDEGLYTVIYVKKDGKWKISNLVESPVPATSPHDRLSELDWLIGTWEDSDKNDKLTVRSQFVWARGGNFITRNVSVTREGEPTLEGWQIIGWDPIAQQIHSWTFDSEGGYSNGTWTHDGNNWLARQIGVTPDGDRTTADETFIQVSPDRFTWESNNRTVDGEPMPSISRIQINRVKGQ